MQTNAKQKRICSSVFIFLGSQTSFDKLWLPSCETQAAYASEQAWYPGYRIQSPLGLAIPRLMRCQIALSQET